LTEDLSGCITRYWGHEEILSCSQSSANEELLFTSWAERRDFDANFLKGFHNFLKRFNNIEGWQDEIEDEKIIKKPIYKRLALNNNTIFIFHDDGTVKGQNHYFTLAPP
jgi:hypothetical protein